MSISSAAPYHDTHSEADDYLQVLFRPDYSVQSRELNELQSIAASQLSRLGRHIFQNGSPVTGGALTYKVVTYVKLHTSPAVNPALFLGARVIEKTPGDVVTGCVAKVVQYAAAANGDPHTLYLDFETTSALTEGNKLVVEGDTLYATIQTGGDPIGQANFLGVANGVFFVDNRFPVVPAQSIILDKYSTDSTGKAGFAYEQSLITEYDAPALLDPATGYEGASAPGAHRMKMSCTLAYYPAGEEPPEQFVNLLDLIRGTNTLVTERSQYSELAKELARRTYDESGDYTVRPFGLTLEDDDRNFIVSISRTGTTATALCARDHGLAVDREVTVRGVTGANEALYNGLQVVTSVPNSKTFTYTMDSTPSANAVGTEIYFTDELNFSAILSPGKAYVRGFEAESVVPTPVKAPRARDTKVANNYTVSSQYGNYVIVKNVSGVFDPAALQLVNLYSTNNGSGTTIGTARVRFMRWHSGAYGNANLRFRMYLYDTKYSGSVSFDAVRSIKHVGSSALAVVAEESIDGTNAFLSSPQSAGLVFPIPQSTVKTLKPNATDTVSYTSVKKFSGSASGGSVAFSVSGDSYFVGPSGVNFAGTDEHLSGYMAFNASTGDPVTISAITLSSANQTCTMTVSPSNADVRLIAPVQVVNAAPKSKTLTTVDQAVSGSTITRNAPTVALGHADVVEIVAVYDSGTQGEVATALDPDIKANFSFDNGQRDSFYDAGSISVKPNAALPAGDIVIRYSYYAHSGDGFFSVDSYPGDYADIPSYTHSSGSKVRLSDVIDFRPRLNSGAHEGNLLPVPTGSVTADYEFYLPRRDLLVLRALDKRFAIVQGVSALNPQYPKAPDDAMVLYRLTVPPYTFEAYDVEAKFVENKRYTMRDIGVIERRVDRLEYVTALSLLELETKQKPILDENGFDRFKNGIMVDGFKTFGTADVESADWRASLDLLNGELRPRFSSASVKLQHEAHSNTTYVESALHGKFAILPFTTEAFAQNLQATKAESVNPYLVYDYVGVGYAVPPSDDWKDEVRRPDLLVNLSGQADNWELAANGGAGTSWNDWETNWLGVVAGELQSATPWETSTVVEGNVTTTTQTRQVTANTVQFNNITKQVGDRVVDVNVIPFMRATSIKVICHGLRPSRDLHVFFDGQKANSLVTPVSGFAPSSEGSCRSNSSGAVELTIAVPAQTYRTGTKVIQVIDEANALEANASTWAKVNFTASGISVTKEQTIVSTRVPELVPTTRTETTTTVNVTQPPNVNPPWTPQEGAGGGSGGEGGDPFAQTFFVDPSAYPYGMFLTSAKLYFRQKGTQPIEVHIRPTVNGYPSSTDIVPMSRVVKLAADVAVPADTDDMASIIAAPTEFTFQVPIYLRPGQEYALILYAPDTEYEAYISVLGQNNIGSDRVVTQQGTLGSLFKSQNIRTWTPFQEEDLMFELRKARFTQSSGTVTLDNVWDSVEKKANLYHFSSAYVDMQPAATVSFEGATKNFASGVLGSFLPIEQGRNVELTSAIKVNAADSLKVRATLSTTNLDVSPLLDLEKQSFVFVRNIINDMGLLQEGMLVTAPGTYSGTPTWTVSGGGGTGATVTSVMSGGGVASLTVVDPGRDYTSLPTFTPAGGTGSGATATYYGFETSPNQGNALARYVSKRMVLLEDFETDYLSVIADVNVPAACRVKVYYRAKAADDPMVFEQRPWVEMKRKTEGAISAGGDQFREVSWIPEGANIGYTSGGVAYPRAKTIQIKVVLLSSDDCFVPRLRSLRTVTTINA